MATNVDTPKIPPTTQRPAWKALEANYKQVSALHLRDMFAKDAGRGDRMTAEAVGIFLDYSKNRVTDETLKLLVQLAEESAALHTFQGLASLEPIQDLVPSIPTL